MNNTFYLFLKFIGKFLILLLGLPSILLFTQADSAKDNSYFSDKTFNFLLGISTDKDLKYLYSPELNNNLGIISLSYRISNFPEDPYKSDTQLGLYNEFGVNIFSLYYKFGGIIRINNNFSLIANLGLFVGIREITAFALPRMGIITGGLIAYQYPIDTDLKIKTELGTQKILFRTGSFNYQLKIGISKKLYHFK